MYWRVEMLGGLKVQGKPGISSVKPFRTRRAALLLAYLALKPGIACSRERLCEMLWPEEDPQVQRSRLRYELATLRSSFGSDLFAAGSGNASVSLRPGITSDVSDLDRLTVQMARTTTAEHRLPLLRQSVALYQGDLLPGYELPEGCPPEYDWINLERQRLRDAASNAATTLVTDLMLLGLHDEAALLYRDLSVSFPEVFVGAVHTSGSISAKTASVGEARALYQVNAVAPFVPLPPVPLLQGRFFGRTEELRFVRDWVEQKTTEGQKRVLTILGPGGIGKTRLMLEAVLGRSSAVLVPLAGAGSAGQIDEAIHNALALTRQSGMSLHNQIVQALHVRPDSLLLLDNCEHLAAACAMCVHELMTACPRLRIVATSQRPLELAEEQPLTLTTLSLREAGELFLERARVVRPDFAATPTSLAAAKEIVALLDGIPLALELAAARAALLRPDQMCDQLRRRLTFLTSAQQARPPRHRSMRAVLQWSVDLLAENARRALASLSVFRTGATIGAVQAVVPDDVALLDALEELRLCSLLLVHFPDADSKEEAPRYDLLFLVREYAAELLSEPERDKAKERHALFWCEQAKPLPAAFHAGQWETIRRLLVPDRENIRAAIEGSIALNLGDMLYRLTDTLCTAFLELGFWDDAHRLLNEVETARALDGPQRVRLLGLQGALARRRGEETLARVAWEHRLTLARELNNLDDEVMIVFDLAGQALDVGEWDRAETLVQEGILLAEQEDSPFRSLVGRVLLARLRLAQGRTGEARGYATAVWQTLSCRDSIASQTLYVAVNLLPVFRGVSDDANTGELIRVGLPLAVDTGQTFALARLLDEAAPFWEACARIETARLGFYIATEIHSELSSRLQREARFAWAAFCKRHPQSEERNATAETAPSWRHATEALYDRECSTPLKTPLTVST